MSSKISGAFNWVGSEIIEFFPFQEEKKKEKRKEKKKKKELNSLELFSLWNFFSMENKKLSDTWGAARLSKGLALWSPHHGLNHGIPSPPIPPQG